MFLKSTKESSRRRRNVIFVYLAFLCIIASCGTAAFAQQATFISVPLRVVDGLPTIQITVNSASKKPVVATVLVDTGSVFDVFSERFASKLGFNILTESVPGTTEKTKSIINPEMNLGGVTIDGGTGKSEVLSLPDSPISHKPIDGIIGMQLLNEFAVIFDYPRNQLILCYGQLTSKDIERFGYVAPFDKPIPFTKAATDQPYIPYFDPLIDGKPLHTMIDTGNGVTILPDSVIRGKNYPSFLPGIVMRFSGHVKVTPYRITSIDLGTTKYSSPIVTFIHINSPYDPDIGLDLLAQNRILFDFPHRQFFIRSDPEPSEMLSASMARTTTDGLRFGPDGKGVWRILGIKSAAVFPGVEVGDELAKVGEQTLGSLQPDEIKKLFVNRPISLMLLREGKSVHVVLH